jgi:uncharacterized protein (TIGR02996 family)
MNPEGAFLQAIRETPDDDAPRLIYADWLDEHGGPAGAARAELIWVQCALASLPADDPGRAALAEREKALVDAHWRVWTDGEFAHWLAHLKRDCPNPQEHDFCRLVADGIRTRLERDALLQEDERRTRLDRRLAKLGQRMEANYNYTASTRDMSLFEEAEFRRGFVERVVIQDWAVILFAEAIPELGVVREMAIENDALADIGDEAISRLVAVLDRLPLRELDSCSALEDLETAELLAESPAMSRLMGLNLWFQCGETGDEVVGVLASSPHLTGLRSLRLEHSQTFTDEAFLAILDSPTLAGLTHCWLRPNEGMVLSREVIRRFQSRFGEEGVRWVAGVRLE